MARLGFFSILWVVFLCVIFWNGSFGYGQSLEKKNLKSTSRGLDYFAASKDPQTKTYIYHIENAHIDRVVGWIRKGRMGDALENLKYALDRVPNHSKGLHLLFVYAKINKDPLVANFYYQRALKFYPQYALTHAQYGLFLANFGAIDKGIVMLKNATEMDLNLTQGYVWLAEAYYKKGDLRLARQNAERARMLGYKGKITGMESDE